jgi:5'-3' exonuclease
MCRALISAYHSVSLCSPACARVALLVVLLSVQPFQFLLLNVLREYLAHDLYVPNLPFAWDLEHVIDDFVFLCQ